MPANQPTNFAVDYRTDTTPSNHTAERENAMNDHKPHPKTADAGVRNVERALSTISGHWQPHLLTTLNDYDVKVVKLQGEFVWHTHPDTDELFFVVQGDLTIQLRDRDVLLAPNDVFVVPKGVEHCPKADGEVHAILFERQGTLNTGDAGGELTSQTRKLS